MSQDAAGPRVWVDADACPAAVREILCRAAERTRVPVTFVANHAIPVPRSPWVSMLRVERGFDVADNEIARRANPGELVITADIPLASAVIDKGAAALNPRGEMYSTETIRSLLNMRDFMDTLRASGVQTGGPPPLHARDRKQFADALDRWLTGSRRAD